MSRFAPPLFGRPTRSARVSSRSVDSGISEKSIRLSGICLALFAARPGEYARVVASGQKRITNLHSRDRLSVGHVFAQQFRDSILFRCRENHAVPKRSLPCLADL